MSFLMDHECLLSTGAQCNGHDEVKSDVIGEVWNRILPVPSLCFHSTPTGTLRSHQPKHHGHIFKKANGKNEYGYLEGCTGGKS